MNAISVKGLTKIYGSVHALDGLNLEVAPNTVFGFLGPNGAGKTTTIRLLTGLAKPSSGTAVVAGETIQNVRRVAERIGYLPEEPAFYDWMTPTEYLDHVGRLFCQDSNQRKSRVTELLQLSGLTEAGKRRIHGFSRGMRQRLGLAQALFNKPEVLFLDEPASALDPVGRKEVLDLIERLRGSCTVFMSTHILADVERVCDTIGIINKGKMLVEAQQDDLRARYAQPIFEVEVLPEDIHKLADWSQVLSKQSWVKNTSIRDHTVRILVQDIQLAREKMLTALTGSGLAIRRFEEMAPSLEDIFLRLINKEGELP